MRRCRLKESGEVYALKQMCKADIVAMGQVALSMALLTVATLTMALLTMTLLTVAKLTMALPTTGQVEHIMQETRILSSIAHPFVTNKYGALVTPGNLILIMEYCPGGDLFDQLYRRKQFSLDDVRIFVSQARLPPHRVCVR